MSRYRSIHCKIWIDDKFPFLSDDSQLAWLHAFTCPFSNGIGIYHASLEALAANKRWPVERYRKAFAEPLAKLMVSYDEAFQVVYFRAFFKHNRASNPNVFLGLLRLYDELPRCSLVYESLHNLKTFAEGWGKPFSKVYETYMATFPKQEQYQEQYQDIMSSSSDDVIEEQKTIPKFADEILQVIDYLNDKTGKSFRPTNKDSREKISARLNEGYKIEDFFTVIDNKVKGWKGTEHEKYLQPSTLFRVSHFDNYLNEIPRLREVPRRPKEEPWLPDVSGVYAEQ